MYNTKIVSRPWQPQDLIDDLQGIIDEECDNYLNTRRTTLCMARDYLKEHFATDNNVGDKWIPVSERLPEYGQQVIVYSGNVLSPSVFAYHFWNKDYDSWVHITHWMPLPEPPKGE